MQGCNEIKLKKIFEEMFGTSGNVTKISEVTEPRWTSLSATELLMAIESEFNVKLDFDDIERMVSYNAAKQLLEELGF